MKMQRLVINPAKFGPVGDFDVVPYHSLAPAEWDYFIDAVPSGWLTETSDWMRFFELGCGYRNMSFALRVNGRIRVAMPLWGVPNMLGGWRLISGPFFDQGGPFFETRDERLATTAIEQVIKMARKYGIRHIEFRNPPVPVPGGRESAHYCHFLFALRRDEDVIFRSLGENVRRAVRKGLKSCVTRTSQLTEDLKEVWRLYSKVMIQHGTPPWGELFFAMFAREMEQGRGWVILASSSEEVVAGGYVWGNGMRARLEIAACPSEEGKKAQAISVIFWEAILLMNRFGYQELDFSRSLIDGPHYDFKKRWGAQERSLPFVYLGINRVPIDPRKTWMRHGATILKRCPEPFIRAVGDAVRIRMAM